MYRALLICICVCHYTLAVLVSVEQGVLRGNQMTAVTKDAIYYSFKGIPYAAPPLGKLRFQPPQPPARWKGIRNATQHGSICIQLDAVQRKFYPCSEDCLFLNVYTPSIKPSSPLAVMFYIHGGSFMSGSGNDDFFGPDFLIRQNIILVTFNYRLDALGFMSLGSKEVPGNAGMKDQVAALKWVQRNIAQFGGNPDKVTIIGNAAGAISCLLHCLSPMSKGLFTRAIAMSRVPLQDVNVEFESARRGFNLGKIMGYETKNATALYEFLQNVPAYQFLNTKPHVIIAEIYVSNLAKMYQFGPVVEKDYGQERFLTETFVMALVNGNINDVDIMIGYSNNEGLFGIPYFEDYLINVFNTYPELLNPRRFLCYLSANDYLPLSDAIKYYYFGNKPISLDTMEEFINYYSDTFKYQALRYIRDVYLAYSKKKFLYRFSGDTERNVFSSDKVRYGLTGAAQRDIEMYLFHAVMFKLPINTSSESFRIIEYVTTLFANFAKYGNPTPDASFGVTWDEYEAERESFMDIGSKLTPGTHPETKLMKFWRKIYKRADTPFYHVGVIPPTQ